MTADAARTAWLDQLEAAHTAATPGPWTERQNYIDQGVPDNSKTLNGGNGDYLGTIVLNYRGHDNAAAIVAEHNAMPALLALARGVAELAETYEIFAATLHTVPAAESYADAAESLQHLLAAAAPHTGQETP